MNIDWNSKETHFLFNPRMPAAEARGVRRLLQDRFELPGHVWLATSGSTAQAPGLLKWVALSKEALLESASAVNAHLESDRTDIWIHALPTFHVGGLGILARAFQSGARVAPAVDESRGKWDPRLFHRICARERGTLSALVPTQLHDLTTLELRAPASMRAVVVGGGALPEPLRLRARALGWNPLPSYGSTECCSQVATAELNDPRGGLRILPHFEVATDPSGRLKFRGKSLLTGYALIDQDKTWWVDPKDRDKIDPKKAPKDPASIDENARAWFLSEDLGQVQGGYLLLRGRNQDRIKVGGETVDLARLSRIAEELRMELQNGLRAPAEACPSWDVALFPVPDGRLGEVIHVAFAPRGRLTGQQADRFLSALESRVLPFEKPREVHFLEKIPRSPLGKLLRADLIQQISSGSPGSPDPEARFGP